MPFKHNAARRSEDVPNGPIHLVIDCTGLKLFGQGEWSKEKHGRNRRSWRKLHVAVHAGTGEIVACVLPDNDADDAARCRRCLSRSGVGNAAISVTIAFDEDTG
jgi:Transposase DDE domain